MGNFLWYLFWTAFTLAFIGACGMGLWMLYNVTQIEIKEMWINHENKKNGKGQVRW